MTVHLFVREIKVADGDLGAPPYLYAGPMTYQKHGGPAYADHLGVTASAAG
ncbi:hypothetical protein [Micromonospora fulviviridis]|uniref:Uncharacterized protein n=1 Tax=Micromonospora fulviviridis TaxID=47860 RepID=A0ABV2VTT5_9ACTN